MIEEIVPVVYDEVRPIAVRAMRDERPTHPLSPTAQTLGRYSMQRLIGSGGMAIVYKARDKRLGRDVALKFLSPWLSADPGARSRFLAEAQAAAALDHPRIGRFVGTGAHT